jgi:hypothetical protein
VAAAIIRGKTVGKIVVDSGLKLVVKIKWLKAGSLQVLLDVSTSYFEASETKLANIHLCSKLQTLTTNSNYNDRENSMKI